MKTNPTDQLSLSATLRKIDSSLQSSTDIRFTRKEFEMVTSKLEKTIINKQIKSKVVLDHSLYHQQESRRNDGAHIVARSFAVTQHHHNTILSVTLLPKITKAPQLSKAYTTVSNGNFSWTESRRILPISTDFSNHNSTSDIRLRKAGSSIFVTNTKITPLVSTFDNLPPIVSYNVTPIVYEGSVFIEPAVIVKQTFATASLSTDVYKSTKKILTTMAITPAGRKSIHISTPLMVNAIKSKMTTNAFQPLNHKYNFPSSTQRSSANINESGEQRTREWIIISPHNEIHSAIRRDFSSIGKRRLKTTTISKVSNYVMINPSIDYDVNLSTDKTPILSTSDNLHSVVRYYATSIHNERYTPTFFITTEHTVIVKQPTFEKTPLSTKVNKNGNQILATMAIKSYGRINRSISTAFSVNTIETTKAIQLFNHSYKFPSKTQQIVANINASDEKRTILMTINPSPSDTHFAIRNDISRIWRQRMISIMLKRLNSVKINSSIQTNVNYIPNATPPLSTVENIRATSILNDGYTSCVSAEKTVIITIEMLPSITSGTPTLHTVNSMKGETIKPLILSNQFPSSVIRILTKVRAFDKQRPTSIKPSHPIEQYSTSSQDISRIWRQRFTAKILKASNCISIHSSINYNLDLTTNRTPLISTLGELLSITRYNVSSFNKERYTPITANYTVNDNLPRLPSVPNLNTITFFTAFINNITKVAELIPFSDYWTVNAKPINSETSSIDRIPLSTKYQVASVVKQKRISIKKKSPIIGNISSATNPISVAGKSILIMPSSHSIAIHIFTQYNAKSTKYELVDMSSPLHNINPTNYPISPAATQMNFNTLGLDEEGYSLNRGPNIMYTTLQLKSTATVSRAHISSKSIIGIAPTRPSDIFGIYTIKCFHLEGRFSFNLEYQKTDGTKVKIISFFYYVYIIS